MQELKFMLMREWNLYNSVYYSNYIYSKLQIWSEFGKKDMERFFAKLGIPISEAKQQYRFMDHKYKELLEQNIEKVAEEFKLENIIINSFVRQVNEKTQLSASDMVYSITSLLEAPSKINEDDIKNVSTSKEVEPVLKKNPGDAVNEDDIKAF